MIGETTLAMLYVPLFFYLFDQLTEKLAERKKARAEAREGEGTKGPPADEQASATGEGG
jgi:multidrug efflux pump